MHDYIGSLEFICPRCKRENRRQRFLSSENRASARKELSSVAKCHFCLFRPGDETQMKIEVSPTAYANAA
jgi:hypothetical protein